MVSASLLVQVLCGYAWGKLTRSLKPCGSRVSSFCIQKSSLLNNVVRICSFVKFLWEISSMMIIRKSRLKSCSGSMKCRSMPIESCRFASFPCLFILLLAPWDSTFPTYCPLLHLMQKPKYIQFRDLQLTLWRISNRVSPVLSVK